MKIKEQNEQHMVIRSAFGGRLVGAFALVLAIGWTIGIQFIQIMEMRVILSLAGLIIICITLGSVMISIVIDKSTQTVTINHASFFVFNKKSVIPFSVVRNVHINCEQNTGEVRRGQPEINKCEVFIDFIKIAESTNRAEMFQLASKVSQFIGAELVDNSVESE